MMVFITQYIISPSNIRPSLKIFHNYLFIMFRLEETLKYPIIKSVQPCLILCYVRYLKIKVKAIVLHLFPKKILDN